MKRRRLLLAAGAGALARPLWSLQLPGDNPPATVEPPPQPAQSPVSLYDPTRYVFVADKGMANIAVVDLEEERQVDTLRSPVAIRTFASSTDKPWLAISDQRRYAITLINLETRDIQEIPLPSRAFRLTFVPESSKLAVTLEDRVGMVDYRTGEAQILEKTFQNLYTRFNTIFSVYSQTFWVLQENTPLIYQYSYSAPEKGWQTIDIGETRGLGSGAPSFEDRLIAFTTYYADEGIIYFADTGKVIKTGPLYDSKHLNERLLEPFIDNGMKHVIFGDLGGNILIYEPDVSDEPKRLQLGLPPAQIPHRLARPLPRRRRRPPPQHPPLRQPRRTHPAGFRLRRRRHRHVDQRRQQTGALQQRIQTRPLALQPANPGKPAGHPPKRHRPGRLDSHGQHQ